MKAQKKKYSYDKIFMIFGIIFLLLFFFCAISKSMSNEQKCIEQGYEGSVTYFGFPLEQCYIDNREFKEQINKVEFYPLK